MDCKILTPAVPAAEAAAIAVSVNPQNAPSLPVLAFGLAAVADVLPPDQLSLLTGKKWKPQVRLGVTFASGTQQAVKDKVLRYANKWGQFGDIVFAPSSQGEVRVEFGPSGYWSYLGTDILSIPARQPTMNLQGFDRTMPDYEWERVVVHEFGHTLGFPHEHERAEINARLDREKVIAEFMRTQGWSRQQVIDQIFSPPAPGSIMASALADERSIMCYGFPGHLTLNGQPIPGGNTLTRIDQEFVARIHPLPANPPPPPNPPGKTIFVAVPDKTAIALNVADVIPSLVAAGYKVTPI